MMRLKLQYLGHLVQRANSLENILILGKIEGKGETETEDKMVGWHHRLNGHEFKSSGNCWRTGKPGVLQSMGWQRVGHN